VVAAMRASASSRQREAALDNYPRDDKTILPNLVDIIRSENRFNELTNQTFLFWEAQALLDWWDKNQKSVE
jgi:hypothetical protein